MKKLSRRKGSGAVAIEYGLIAALVVVVMIPAVQSLGGNTNSMWGNISNRVGAALAR